MAKSYINLDEEFICTKHREGTSAKGPWELITVVDKDKGNNEISVWVENYPSNVVEGGYFRVKEIKMVSFGKRKYEAGDGVRWLPQVSVNAIVEPTGSPDALPDGDLPDADISDAELPW